MKTKKNLLTIILVILIVLNIGALTAVYLWHKDNVQNHPHRTEMKHHKMAANYLKDELQLTDTQNQAMEKLKMAHRDTLGYWADKMREKRDFLTMEMMKSAPDDSLLNATCDQIGDIYATIRKLNITHYRDMKSICNDEQKKKLDTVFKGIFCCDDAMFDRFQKKHGGCGMPEGEKHEGCMNDNE